MIVTGTKRTSRMITLMLMTIQIRDSIIMIIVMMVLDADRNSNNKIICCESIIFSVMK